MVPAINAAPYTAFEKRLSYWPEIKATFSQRPQIGLSCQMLISSVRMYGSSFFACSMALFTKPDYSKRLSAAISRVFHHQVFRKMSAENYHKTGRKVNRPVAMTNCSLTRPSPRRLTEAFTELQLKRQWYYSRVLPSPRSHH